MRWRRGGGLLGRLLLRDLWPVRDNFWLGKGGWRQVQTVWNNLRNPFGSKGKIGRGVLHGQLDRETSQGFEAKWLQHAHKLIS